MFINLNSNSFFYQAYVIEPYKALWITEKHTDIRIIANNNHEISRNISAIGCRKNIRDIISISVPGKTVKYCQVVPSSPLSHVKEPDNIFCSSFKISSECNVMKIRD